MSPITTHILDVSSGIPAQGVSVILEWQTQAGDWVVIGQGATDRDGRLRDLLTPDVNLVPGKYRLVFETEAYFLKHQTEGFYPHVVVAFKVSDGAQHYHVPLLLSPFGYSTYRGS